ncbi:MAG: ComF family protein [Proteobacteria bacterium]|nr:ComF family protein [Pseudomonadota bacterium]
MWQALCDLLFVPHCPACDARAPEVGTRAGLCPACTQSLYPLDSACPRCAEPIAGPRSIVCARCRRTPPPVVSTHAPYRYGGELAVALRRLKYQRRAEIARALAPLIAPALQQAAGHADVAMPVPLHWRRFCGRGFNQAALLLRHAGRGLDIPLDRLSLRRVRATLPQSGLDTGQRAGNVAAAFAVVPRRRDRVAQRRILLVDDVITTGATMASAARALLGAGANSVIAFSAARVEL